MKAIKITLSNKIKNLELHTLSDLHLGDNGCSYREIAQTIEDIKNNKNAYVILNGDLINNATTQSVSDTYAEQLSPMEQLRQAVDLFTPIKDKILAITSGNHEHRTYKTDGIDLTEILARELECGDRYADESALIFLRFGEDKRGRKATGKQNQIRQICYTIYTTHGSGGGRREGGKVNRLIDLAGIVDADIYILSHTHLPVVVKQAFFRTDVRNSSVAFVDKLFVNTSAWLNYGGYGERQGYKPSSKHNPIIYLCGTKKEFKAKL